MREGKGYSVEEEGGDKFFFFFKQKTAYEIVSRDWSSDVCSSDLASWLEDQTESYVVMSKN